MFTYTYHPIFHLYSSMESNISRVYEGLFDSRAIYIGDGSSAHDIHLLQNLNITAVLTVAQQFNIHYPLSVVPEHLYTPAIDRQDYDIESIFGSTFQFIERVHRSRNVLIHCAVGASRSASVFIAYLIRKYGHSLESALAITKRRRRIINPNRGFMIALQRYSDKYSLQEGSQSILAGRKSKLTLRKKLSLNQDKSMYIPQPNKFQKATSVSESISPIEDLEGLNQVLEQKQLVEEKLKQIQSYYRRRSCKESIIQKFNSCFESRKPQTQALFQTFAKNQSSEL